MSMPRLRHSDVQDTLEPPHALAVAARLVGDVVADAKADGALIAWSNGDGAPEELRRAGSLTAVSDEASRRWFAEAEGGTLGGDGFAWREFDGEAAMAAGTVRAGGARLTAVIALASPSAGALARVRRAFARVAPILAAHLGQLLELRRVTGRAGDLAAAMNAVDVATALIDRAGRASFVNGAMERLLARRDGLTLNGGRFGSTGLAETIRLQSAVSHVLSDAGPTAPVVAVRRAHGARPLLVAVARAAVVTPDHAATLQVFDPDQELAPLLEPVCRLYRLTPVEGRLACLLADGRSLAEASVQMRIREQTARSYLKQVFQKTETKRQAELVWLMLRSGVRSARNGPVSFF